MLCVKFGDVKQYKIDSIGGRFSLLGGDSFSSIAKLVTHYEQNDIGNGGRLGVAVGEKEATAEVFDGFA